MVGLTFESVDEILNFGLSSNTTEQNFEVVEFVLLYNTALTFKTLDETIPVVLFI